MNETLHHLAAAYALDALSAEERRAFEAHYPSCEICAVEVREFRETAAKLAGASAVAPAADLRARVLGEIAATRQLSPTPVVDLSDRRRSTVRRVAVSVAAAAAVVVVVALAASILRSGPAASVDDVIDASDAVVTRLDGADGAITIVWTADDDRVAILGTDLAAPGPGQAYALWFVTDAGVAPAGLFEPTNGTIARVLDVDDAAPTGWGVTIEPDTGSEQPTGEIIFSGTV